MLQPFQNGFFSFLWAIQNYKMTKQHHVAQYRMHTSAEKQLLSEESTAAVHVLDFLRLTKTRDSLDVFVHAFLKRQCNLHLSYQAVKYFFGFLKKIFRKDNRHKKTGRRTTQDFFKKNPRYIHIREAFDMTESLAGAGSKQISWPPQRHIVIALPLVDAKLENFQNERSKIYHCSR